MSLAFVSNSTLTLLELVVEEILNQLTLFCKMATSLENLSVGDVFVVLKEDNLTPTKWLIARVVEVDLGLTAW